MLHEVVAALIIRSQKILLGQRSSTRKYYPNVWDVFGGHVEPGEGHEQTLVRELSEPSDQLTLHLYLVTAWTGTPVNRQLDEHSEIGWFSLAQATQIPLAHRTYPKLFARYLDIDQK